MNKEFNLSRHISYKNIHVKWVQEFIRLLKEGIRNAYVKNELNGHLAVNCLGWSECNKIIDKLSGKKLTGAS